ncbi:Het domain protein [Apiospora rasikravindrae]|uniref:Het domain protein n=1 Tax=Apiospora rasikravindrae TaxID=990691 RepID=A0ABR1SD15_9PEZI
MEADSEPVRLGELSENWPSCLCLSHLCRYDGAGFDGFLDRQGWALTSRDPYYDALVRSDRSPSTGLDHAAVLQAWLFFGLAIEALNIVGVALPLDELVDTESSPPKVTMTRLPSYIRIWQASENDQPPHIRKAHLDQLWKRLRRAGGFVDSLLSFPKLKYDEERDSMTQLEIAESIAMLGDKLMNVARIVWCDLDAEIEVLEKGQIRQKFRFSEPATLSLKRLEKIGWCKSTRMMMHRLVDTSGLYYCGLLTRDHMLSGHQDCSIFECKTMTINKDDYEVRHVSDSCSCQVVTLDRDIMAEALDRGEIPCVRIEAGKEDNEVCNARVVDSNQGYVAFSHVWAHGFGNPNVNGLPCCQLKRLQTLAISVESQRSRPGENLSVVPSLPDRQTVAFWIDTLCIPVGDEFAESRRQAILRLTDVFHEAEAVLVLDREVEQVPTSVSYLEKELRVITCDWMRRVWTLQEALLTKPSRLYWQFANDALPADDIWIDNSRNDPLYVTYKSSAFSKRLPALGKSEIGSLQFSENFLAVVYALRYRSLSRKEDETICLAPILGLERAALLQSKDHIERMKILAGLWGNLPTYLLFLEGERITQPGYRWLPISFIRGLHKSTATRAPYQFTQMRPEGLFVVYPGILIDVKAGASPSHCQLGFRSGIDGMWYTIKDSGGMLENKLPEEQRWSHWRSELSNLHRPALVVEYPSDYSDNYLIAVLVDVEDETDSVFYARYLCRVWLDCCDFDLRFLEQPQPRNIRAWIETVYREKVADVEGLPPTEAFVATKIEQQWCIT